MAAEKTPTRAHQLALGVERQPESRLRFLAAVLAGVAVLFLVLLMMVLEHLSNPWLRAPLVLLTGGGMSAAGVGLGAAFYELRYRQRSRARSNAADDRGTRAAS